MENFKIGWLAVGALAAAVVLVAVLVYARFRRDMRVAREHLRGEGSNAVDDPLTLYRNAQSAAERIPGAKLVTIEDGGHMLLGHEERVRSEIAAFLGERS